MAHRARSRSLAGVVAAGSIMALVVACSSSSGGGSSKSFPPNSTEYTGPDGSTNPIESPGTCSGAVGGPVLGPQDNHCDVADGGRIAQITTAAGCTAMTAPGDDGGSGDDGGGATLDPCPGDMNAYAAGVLYNTSASDDDCKYDVSWQSTPICQGQPVYFTVIVTKREDGSPLLGVETGGAFVAANPRPDVVLDCSHPIPNDPAPRDPSPMVAPGTFVVGPIVFDKAGDWVFRFHLNEECLDVAPDSPHGHAAFHIRVP